LAIFLDSGVTWPPALQSLLTVFSAFNLNIEVIAPECLVPSVTFQQKFAAVAVLPAAVCVLFALLAGAGVVWKRLCLGRDKRLGRHVNALVASCLLVLTFLYLYETRSA
jgi:uncharacterized membrane protein YozB (DUF420 family)